MPPSFLLALPVEVRRKIFTYALTNENQRMHMHQSPSCARQLSLLRLLLVCRSIYDESLALFYRFNTLVFGSTSALYTFLSTLQPARRKEIRSLVLEGYGMHYTSTQMAQRAFDLLATCDRLISFRLDLATDFQLRGDLIYLFQSSSAEYKPLDLGHEYERNGWIAGMTSLKKLRGLLYASIRIHSTGEGDDKGLRMVEMPSTGLWGPVCQTLKLRWRRPPLWAHEERGEAEKRMRRWRQGVDQTLDSPREWDDSGVPSWYLYERVMESCMEALGSDSEPDEWA